MTEALIAITMLLICFAGVCFFQRAYLGKVVTMRTARAQAWRATIADDCDGQIEAAEQVTVQMPRMLQGLQEREGGSGTGAMTIRSRDTMMCNVEPEPGDSLLDALTAVGGQLPDFASTAIDFIGEVISSVGG